MSRFLAPVLLIVVIVLSVGPSSCSCSHRGSTLEGPVAEAWAVRFKSPGASYAIGQSIGLDPSGNICVAGTTGATKDNAFDIFAAKYDSAGKRLWLATYDGPAGGADRAADMAVDTDGHVYVSGTTVEPGSSGMARAVIMEYDGNGSQLWVATHDGIPGGNWGKGAVVVDDAGNVYLTGGTYDAEEYSMFFTVKYDTNGTELWDSRYRWPELGDAAAVAMALDKQGNVYVTGAAANTRTARSGEFKSAIITVKYDRVGEELWTAVYESGVQGYDVVSGIAIDSHGDVCIAGHTGWAAEDYLTMKYDHNGKQLWVARYDGPGDSTDEASALCTDALDNIYVTGLSLGEGSDDDYATVKYDKNGNEVWVARYDGPGHGSDIPKAIAVDSSGNSYVTGQSYYAGPEDFDCCTIKYDDGGHQVWVARYNGSASYNDYGMAAVVDDSGDVYVTGQIKITDDNCYCLIAKYIPA